MKYHIIIEDAIDDGGKPTVKLSIENKKSKPKKRWGKSDAGDDTQSLAKGVAESITAHLRLLNTPLAQTVYNVIASLDRAAAEQIARAQQQQQQETANED